MIMIEINTMHVITLFLFIMLNYHMYFTTYSYLSSPESFLSIFHPLGLISLFITYKSSWSHLAIYFSLIILLNLNTKFIVSWVLSILIVEVLCLSCSALNSIPSFAIWSITKAWSLFLITSSMGISLSQKNYDKHKNVWDHIKSLKVISTYLKEKKNKTKQKSLKANKKCLYVRTTYWQTQAITIQSNKKKNKHKR